MNKQNFLYCLQYCDSRYGIIYRHCSVSGSKYVRHFGSCDAKFS